MEIITEMLKNQPLVMSTRAQKQILSSRGLLCNLKPLLLQPALYVEYKQRAEQVALGNFLAWTVINAKQRKIFEKYTAEIFIPPFPICGSTTW